MQSLIKTGLVETLPQSGTYIKDFYINASLDTLINLINVSNTIDVTIMKFTVEFIITNDIATIGKAAKIITQDNLKKIEVQILKKGSMMT